MLTCFQLRCPKAGALQESTEETEMHLFKRFLTVAALSLMASAAQAKDWTLDGDLSNVSFASIKSDFFGENHSFSDLSGTVSQSGKVELNIGLASIETFIDIRNERIIKHIFKDATTATVTAEIDMAELESLDIGDATTLETVGTLSLVGIETELDAQLFVMRLTEDKVMVTTDGMIMLGTEDAGIDAGIDILKDLASLESITRVSPVTLRLVFSAAEKQS